MIRIACNRDIHEFMYKKFPTILYKYMISRVNNLPKDRIEYLNKIVKDKFKLNDIFDLIRLFIKHLRINNYQNKDYYIMVEDVEVTPGITLEDAVRAIDYGSSEISPYNLFNSSLVYVNNNLEALYKYSYLGVN